MINTSMRINEILKESAFSDSDIVSTALNDPYGAAGSDLDKMLNPEAHRFAQMQHKLNKKREGETHIYTHETIEKNQKKFSNQPPKDNQPSAGYMGLEAVKKRAGIPTKPTL